MICPTGWTPSGLARQRVTPLRERHSSGRLASGSSLLPTALLLILNWLPFAACNPGNGVIQVERQPAPGKTGGWSYEDLATALHVVDRSGMVNYRALKAQPEALSSFIAGLGTLDAQIYERWNREDKIAFWINAYNGLTLGTIVANYPIQPSLLASLRFPRNSIRQIPGVWDGMEHRVLGRQLTLDEIEHSILRKQFEEPRIHLALVCAAKGCPPLRSEPYLGSRLEQQFEDQARRFLADPTKFKIERVEKTILLSRIFDWYGEDFSARYSRAYSLPDYADIERGVLGFILPFLNATDRTLIIDGKLEVRYLDYDWSLNEQQRP